MPLVIKSGKIAEAVSPTPFAAEDQLQALLASHPNLLRHESEPPLALVAREVNLNEAGYLDILMINRDGLPIAVEVKLQRNSEARREVVAQAIDYISTLSTKTVDELDEMVGGQIEGVLRGFDEQVDDEAFERRWRALGANLRAGLVRLLVAVDGATPGLERILRFLAEKSELDVQLIVVQRFIGSNSEEVLVARPTFSAESVSRTSPYSTREIRSELLAAVERYNASADAGFSAVGAAAHYRQIRPQGWPTGARTHYEFYQTNSYLGAELHIESDAARPLSGVLVALVGKPVLNGTKQLVWDQAWSSGRGRLAVRFAPSDNPVDIAQAMKELITITFPIVTERLGELFGPKP
jgi:hypothetical protein